MDSAGFKEIDALVLLPFELDSNIPLLQVNGSITTNCLAVKIKEIVWWMSVGLWFTRK
nr:hypothetical protein [Algoriphagus lutimaris]